MCGPNSMSMSNLEFSTSIIGKPWFRMVNTVGLKLLLMPLGDLYIHGLDHLSTTVERFLFAVEGK